VTIEKLLLFFDVVNSDEIACLENLFVRSNLSAGTIIGMAGAFPA